jgi:anti-sigma regulatory factor (Ser/Thr protein kinase)
VSEQRITLAEGLHAPAQARAWVGARLPQISRQVRDDALLVVSELVTNAVRHGSPEIVVALSVSSDRVRVSVQDGNDTLPAVPATPPSMERPTGRGLLIVSATASDWGVERLPGSPGKRVWAELETADPEQ